MLNSLLLVALWSGLAAPGDAPAHSAEWNRFRGPNGSGVSASTGLPSTVTPTDNVAWKIEIGKGASSPIISGGRLFFSSFDDKERFLESRDAATGEPQWKLSIPSSEVKVSFTPPNGPATVTPITDGERVFAFFPDAGLIAAKVDGTELWRLPLAPSGGMHGIASSLTIAGDKLILLADVLEGSFIAAYECESGKPVWKKDRFNGFTGGHSTPTIYEPGDGSRQLLVFGPTGLVAYAPDNGERVWWVTSVGFAPVGVPILDGNRVIVSEPVFESMPFAVVAGADKNKDGIISKEEIGDDPGGKNFYGKIDSESGNGDGDVTEAEWDKSQEGTKGKGGLAAIELGGKDDVTGTHIKWSYRKQVPYIPSVLLYDGVLYMSQDGGLVTTFDPETGEIIKRGRLKEGGGQFWASPVAADRKVYLINTEGKLTVLKAGKEWEELSFGDLGEQALATPAIANGRLYVRTEKTLWCFERRG